MMDLFEKVKHFIEEDNKNALKTIFNAELANLGECAVSTKKILLAEDYSASSNLKMQSSIRCLRILRFIMLTDSGFADYILNLMHLYFLFGVQL